MLPTRYQLQFKLTMLVIPYRVYLEAGRPRLVALPTVLKYARQFNLAAVLNIDPIKAVQQVVAVAACCDQITHPTQE